MYQHKSGAEKRRGKKRAQEALQNVLSKTPKLDQFFGKKSTDETVSKTPASSQSHCVPDLLVDDLKSSSVTNVSGDGDDIEPSDIPCTNTLPEKLDDFVPVCCTPNPGTSFNCTDIGLWPDSVTDDMRNYWISKGTSLCQNLKLSYPDSYVIDNKQVRRFCTRAMFSYTHEPTQTNYDRSWLCYSDATKKVYCFYCKLFATDSSSFSSHGYNDWKNASQRLLAHEKSLTHLNAVQKFSNMKCSKTRIDHELDQQISAQTMYWTSVLERIVEVIKFLSERGLPFRGHDEIIGSKHNGNYLGALELIAKFDPFLSAHIEKQRILQEEKCGRRTVSYLSSTICNEFINLMSGMVLDTIVAEVKAAKYFSISIDSTPDMSKVDRVTCILRYVPADKFTPVERFLHFLGTNSHTGEELASVLLCFLGEKGIEVKNCRGQSYDNASNMAGKYNGVQAKVKEVCRFAQFVPCFGHSLNLIGNEAASCIPKATAFFEFLQNLYAFFAASTHRWNILKELLRGESVPVLKSLSGTRWSARADATKTLVKGYRQISEALLKIEQDQNERSETRCEAAGMLRKMQQLEYGILAYFWGTLLNRFNDTSLSLQRADLDLNNAVRLMQSLCEFVASMREQFESFEEKGKDLSKCSTYKPENKRKRVRSTRQTMYEGPGEEVVLSPRNAFRTCVFLPIIDNILSSFEKRLNAYSTLCDSFGFLHKLLHMTANEICEATAKLAETYPDDLEQSVSEEFVQFAQFARLSFDSFPEDTDQEIEHCSFEAKLYRLASASDVRVSFPNVNVALRIYLSLLVTNCSGERSFSALSRVKNELRSSMSDERLNSLTLMSIESEILRSINFKDIITQFARAKSRKVQGQFFS